MSGNEWTVGAVNGGLEFDGSNDRVSCGSFDVTGGDNHISMAAWFRADNVGRDGRIISKTAGSWLNSHYWCLTVYGSRLWFLLRTNGITTAQRASSGTLSTGVWTHAAATWDGSTMRIYQDGVLVGSQAKGGTLSTDDSVAVALGNQPGRAWGRPFDGILDDVRVYNRALSTTEVATLAGTLRYEGFAETKRSADTNDLTLSPPAGTSAGDLLVAAVATDGDTSGSLAPPGGQGWTQVDLNHYISEVTLGAWWKLAGASEPSHQFTWSGAEQAYAWVMRFTGHDGTDPIDVLSSNGTAGTSPTSPAVTTSVDNALILRLGAFDGDEVTLDTPGLTGHTAITMDTSAGSGQVSFQAFTEKKLTWNGRSVTLNTPAGTSAGDLLIATVVTDGDTDSSMAPPGGQGWTRIYRGDENRRVSLGTWWKLAGASEAGTHRFTWSSGQEAYAWMMRFTGHHPSSPIHIWEKHDSYSRSPDCDPVTTTLANCMILRIGGFDDGDIQSVDVTGLNLGHTDITMDESSPSSGECSGGAGYEQQAAPGRTSTPDFNLTSPEQYITVTVAIAPATGSSGSGSVSGGAGYVKQTSAGNSATSSFALTASEQAQLLTLALAPAAQTGSTFSTISKGPAHEFAPVKGKTPALARIDDTHYLCAYEGHGDDGWAVVLAVNPTNWTISHGLPFEFDPVKGKRPALARIDSTNYLCVYEGDGSLGWATILTVDRPTWRLSQGTPFQFDALKGKTPALARMDNARVLCAYQGESDDGWSTVLQVNAGAGTISQGASLEFDISRALSPALVQIDLTHYLCTYTSNVNRGWSVVLMPGSTVVTP